MKRRKTNINMALKVAIVESRRTSRRVAELSRVGEVRLSGIVHGRLTATDDEQKALAKVLRRDQTELFPAPAGEAEAR
jgi:hypothetical protein